MKFGCGFLKQLLSLLLSTDTALGNEEVVTAYKRRWDIEVFFKMAKSFLNLAKEYQGRSYDALVAHASRYIMLALAKPDQQGPPNSWDPVSRLLR